MFELMGFKPQMHISPQATGLCNTGRHNTNPVIQNNIVIFFY